MRNYESRFRLPNGKWAYIQLDEFSAAARLHVRRIRAQWPPPDYFYHLRPGGHVAGLRLHLTNSWYGKIDLSNFFGNITRHRLTRCLKRIGYSFLEAQEFAVESTVCVDHAARKFALPYGFVQSPLLASLALDKSELGRCLGRLHAREVTLSAYVDDIIVSSHAADDVRHALEEIRIAATMSRFPINETKSGGPVDSMRAFNIAIGDGAMEIAADRFEEMCQEVMRYGPSLESDGILGYVSSVNDAQAVEMLAAFPRCFPTA